MSIFFTVFGVILGSILLFALVDIIDSSKFINSIREYLKKLGKSSKSSFPEFVEFLLTSEALALYIFFI